MLAPRPLTPDEIATLPVSTGTRSAIGTPLYETRPVAILDVREWGTHLWTARAFLNLTSRQIGPHVVAESTAWNGTTDRYLYRLDGSPITHRTTTLVVCPTD